LAAWTHETGVQSVSFDVKPTDLSPDGTLVVRVVVVAAADGGAVTVPGHWTIRNMFVSVDGQVVGPLSTPPLENEAVDQADTVQPTAPHSKKHNH
jgi:hypothetical protein